MEAWEKLLEEYYEVVHIPMSSGLSILSDSLCAGRQFHDRVQVVDNQRISVTQRQWCQVAMELAKAGKDAVQIKKFWKASGESRFTLHWKH